MPSISRNSEATFRIFLQDDQTYAIEVIIPEAQPTKITSFPSVEKAEEWVASYRERLEAGPQKRRFTRSRVGSTG